MAINLSKNHLDAIRNHGGTDYPNECCGILLGHAHGGQKQVQEVIPLKNLRLNPARAQELLPLESPGKESERNRFLIDPLEQLHVERGARQRSLDVLGYYHSHPDAQARPSEYDREHAWPWYSYIIVSVKKGEPGEMTSWVLSDDRSRFDSEQIEVLNT